MRAKLSLVRPKMVRLKMVSWVKPEEHPFMISAFKIFLSVIMGSRDADPKLLCSSGWKDSCIGVQGFLCRSSCSKPTLAVGFCRSRTLILLQDNPVVRHLVSSAFCGSYCWSEKSSQRSCILLIKIKFYFKFLHVILGYQA